jgi:N-acetylneuraminate synthase
MTKFTAEFTTNHMGNLNVLMKMVEKAKDAGADYIKMQKKNVEKFYSKEKLNSKYKRPYGNTYRDYRKIFEFGKEDFDRFNRKCEKEGIEWFATPQDLDSLRFIMDYDNPFVKVASTNSQNKELLQEIEKSVPDEKTLVISCGGDEIKDIEETLKHFDKHDVIIQHCVSEYPVPNKKLGLGNIEVMKNKFESGDVKIGYSGHEKGIAASIAAIDMGVEMVERHFCLSRNTFVHHIEPSLEPREFKKLVKIGKEKNEYKKYYEELPKEAFDTNFGMSKSEKEFLKNNKYDKNNEQNE